MPIGWAVKLLNDDVISSRRLLACDVAGIEVSGDAPEEVIGLIFFMSKHASNERCADCKRRMRR